MSVCDADLGPSFNPSDADVTGDKPSDVGLSVT